MWETAEENVYKNNKKKEQDTIFEHFFTWKHYNHIVDLFNVDNEFFNSNKFNVCKNNTILDLKANNVLLFKEAYLVKTQRLSLKSTF